jgi:S-adenosylmethionine-diacylglycerol 3-amino-3-carboxypropyl transferase
VGRRPEAPAGPAARDVSQAPFFRGIGYSTCWEDERFVEVGLRPAPGERALCITSGGCLALQCLLAGAEVTALDFNPHQTWLLHFKVAALATLDEPEVWAALGLRPAADRAALYRRLREALPAEARAWWDAHPALVAAGATLQGRQDRYLHAVGRAVRLLQGTRRVRRLLELDGGEAQRAFYEREWSGLAWRALCGVAFSRTVLDRAFDPAHFTHARAGHPAPRFRAAAERLVREVPARGNFYLHYLFDRTYPDDARCPAWLRRGAPSALRVRRPALAAATGSLEAWLATAPDRSLDVLALSNCFDWVSGPQFTALLRDVVRVARPGARLGWWTNLVNTPRQADPDLFPTLVPDPAAAAEVDAGCRTPGYSGCTLYRVRG